MPLIAALWRKAQSASALTPGFLAHAKHVPQPYRLPAASLTLGQTNRRLTSDQSGFLALATLLLAAAFGAAATALPLAAFVAAG